MNTSESLASAVDTVAKQRRTLKVMGDLNTPATIPEGFTQLIEEAIDVASWAPFHYPANEVHLDSKMDSAVPWRFYAFQQSDCLQLANQLIAKGEVRSEQAGIIRMMAAAGTLILTTWLPDPDSLPSNIREQRNTEHIAAASAAVQNMLLAATARGVQTYWSSGGALGGEVCFGLCQIPQREKLLGAIFMFPQSAIESFDGKPGANRDKRGELDQWRSWRQLSATE